MNENDTNFTCLQLFVNKSSIYCKILRKMLLTIGRWETDVITGKRGITMCHKRKWICATKLSVFYLFFFVISVCNRLSLEFIYIGVPNLTALPGFPTSISLELFIHTIRYKNGVIMYTVICLLYTLKMCVRVCVCDMVV